MDRKAITEIESTLESIRDQGLWKEERIIDSAQGREILVKGKPVINFCANNYLGLSNHPTLKNAASRGIDEWGLGLSSVRFICGTQRIHRELENAIAQFLRFDDTILYSSCFDANGGFFETVLEEGDAIVSDALNHASIIDGIRLSKAARFRYAHADMNDLERCLTDARKSARRIVVVTDGVFSMDGDVAPLHEICDLADRFDALIMVDDSHATGFFGTTGRGSIEHCNVMDRVDVVSSTLGKALGGASGGFVTGAQPIISLLRQRSRPYLFSNSLPPALVMASLACLQLLEHDTALVSRLHRNTDYFRRQIAELGYEVKSGVHPIVPIMLGDARLATDMANALFEEGIYVVGFSYPVVPLGAARIRVQISAAHTDDDLDRALLAFKKVREMVVR